METTCIINAQCSLCKVLDLGISPEYVITILHVGMGYVNVYQSFVIFNARPYPSDTTSSDELVLQLQQWE